MVTHSDLDGVPEGVARRTLVAARSIAPCIATLAAGSESGKDAIAILMGVIESAPNPGSRRAKSQRVASAAVEYWNADTWLPEDRASLRSLCASALAGSLPAGSFPAHTALSEVWPEGEYT